MGLGGKPRDERVLAPASTNHENPHECSMLRRAVDLHGVIELPGLFR
jgi:hypothetical protein